MSNFQWAYSRKNTPVPACSWALIGKSTQISVGDVLVLTNASGKNGVGPGGPPVLRPLLSGDTVTTSNGIVGVGFVGIQTDSNGNIQSFTSPVTVDTRGKLDTNNMMLNDLPIDQASGFVMVPYMSFDYDDVFYAITATNVVANMYLRGRVISINAPASVPGSYTVSAPAAGTNAPLLCDAVDVDNAQYNSANGGGRIMVYCNPSFYQNATGNLWTT